MPADEGGPWRGEVWRHEATGRLYAIVGRATSKDPDGEPDGLVVYRALHQGAFYVRTHVNFCQRFTYQYGVSARIRAELDHPPPRLPYTEPGLHHPTG